MHGVKRLFAWMIPRFDPERFNVSLVSLRKKDLSEETLESLGVDITYLHKSKFDPATLPALLKVIDRKQIDILHLHGYGATTFGRMAGAMRRLPTILHEHANLTDTPWFQKVADRLLEPVDRHRDRRLEEHGRLRDQRAADAAERRSRSSTSACRSRSSAGRATPRRSRARAARARHRAGRLRRRHGDAAARLEGQLVPGRRRARGAARSGRRRGSSSSAKGRCASRSRRRRARSASAIGSSFAGFAQRRRARGLGVRPQRVSRRCGRARR